jgi:glycosyltransferase involved in cell wall biosynthesis
MSEPVVHGLVYLTGTYPLLSTTFIDRELEYLEEHGFATRVISIRPIEGFLSPDQVRLVERVEYMLPVRWQPLVRGHLRYALGAPHKYFGTLLYLQTRAHLNLKARYKTLMYFGLGVYASELLRSGGTRHIHVHFVDRATVVALTAARMLNVSFSVTAHANDIFVEPQLLGEKLENARFVITVSEYNKAHLTSIAPDAVHKIVVLFPPPNLERFQTTLKPRPVARRLLSVGRLVEQKGHGDLIRACAELAAHGIDFECHIVGDGPLRGELQTLISAMRLEGRVKLCGAQSSEEIFREYEWADVFVLACIIGKDGSRDGIPVVIEEAMAMQLPVITTELVGIRELVPRDAGIVVPPGVPTALAQAIRTVLALDLTERQRMGARARAVVTHAFRANYTQERLAELFHASLSEC